MNKPFPSAISKRWSVKKISKILLEEAYTGRYIWGKMKRALVPATGRYRSFPAPPEEWVEEYMPHLAVIDEVTAQKARDSFRQKPASNNFDKFRKKQHATHLLSRLTYCGDCGATNPVLRARKKMNGEISGYYGCRRRHVDHVLACRNKFKMPIAILEGRITQSIVARYSSVKYVEAAVENIRTTLRDYLKTSFSREAHQKLEQRITNLEAEERDIETMLAAGKLSGTGAKSLAEIKRIIAEYRELAALPLPDYLPKAEEIVTGEDISVYYQDLLGKLQSEKTAQIALASLVARINIRASNNGVEVELVDNTEGIVKHLLGVVYKWIPHTSLQLGTLLETCMRGSFVVEIEHRLARQTNLGIGEI